jgi:hypothetical protein
MFHGFPTGTPYVVSSHAEPGLAMCVTLKGPSHELKLLVFSPLRTLAFARSACPLLLG